MVHNILFNLSHLWDNSMINQKIIYTDVHSHVLVIRILYCDGWKNPYYLMAFLVFTLRPRPPLKKLFVYRQPTRNLGIASIGREKILLYKIYVGKMFFLFIFKSPVFCFPGLSFKTFQRFATYLLLHFQPFDNSWRTFYFISKL